MNPTHLEQVNAPNTALDHIKSPFVGKDEIIDLMGICLVGRENLFLLGPPGTAKSAMVRALANRLQGKTFEYLLTRFTEPNELFGPFDIRQLREGQLITNTEGMLPEAELIFLDELLNANSAILNSLLMVLNEKVFRRGKENFKLPVLMIVGASNHLPQDEALQALFDRFLLRVNCDNVDPNYLEQVLAAGWKLEKQTSDSDVKLSAEAVKSLQTLLPQVSLGAILPSYIELIQQLRNTGLKVSDRRAVKLQRLIAASAILCGRLEALPSDMWVMRYIWDTEDQREVIASLVNAVVEKELEKTENVHPQASQRHLPDPEAMHEEVNKMIQQWSDPNVDAAARAQLKDRLRHLSSRAAWIQNEVQRDYVTQPINALWAKIMQQA